MNRLFIFIIFLSSALSARSQSIHTLNLKNGLSNNYVQCLLQDKQGYIWIGTRDGLNRFDGHQLDTYRKELPSGFIYSLFEASDGNIWIGTSLGGVSIYNPRDETFRTLANLNSSYREVANKDAYAFFEDSQGMWIGTLQGLGFIPAKEDTMYWYQNKIDGFDHMFTSICTDKNNNLLFGTNRGLYTLNKSTGPLHVKPALDFPQLDNIFIRDILIDATGKLIIATDNEGIYVGDPKTKRVANASGTHVKNHGQVWKLYRDSHDQIWAAVINKGILQYDQTTKQFLPYREQGAALFQNKSITHIIQDLTGNLWLASQGDGVIYFNPDRYVFEKHFDGSSKFEGPAPAKISSFLEDHQGMIWIGTDGDGLKTLKNDASHQVSSFPSGLSSNTILDMVEDEAHGKWLALWQGGVNYIPSGTNRVEIFNNQTPQPFGLKNPNVKALMKDANSNIWMVTHGRGVAVYNTVEKKFINPETIVPAFQPDFGQWGSDILQTKNGEIWIASHAGLYRYEKDTVQQYHGNTTKGALASSLIYCLYEDHSGTIWIGTNTSLERFIPQTNSFENYTELYQVPGNIKCIQEDRNHHLWISTIHEIIELDPVKKSVRHFDESYNIQQGQFYECACMRSKAGKLYFGGTEGFNSFWPDSISENEQSSKVLISNLFLFNKKQTPATDNGFLKQSMAFTKSLVLPHNQNVISFEFLAINYSAFNQTRYSYKMEGFDREWSPPSEKRIATYTNLDAGDYVLKVRSVDINGRTLSENSVRIEIVPPFWNTFWFRALSLAALILLTVGYLLLRLYNSKQKRLRLQQLVAERTREINEKNLLLEKQKSDLQNKNIALTDQEIKIKEQAAILIQQKDQLQQNNIALQDVVATKDRLFSIIAHDLRNPFTSILGFSKLLNSEIGRYSDEEKQKIFRSLYHSSTSVYSLLENLLAWSRSQQEVVVFAPERLSFRTIVEEHFDLIKDEAEKKGVTLSIGTSQDVLFQADKNMLNIIFRNLLSNALRHSPVNGTIEAGYFITQNVLHIYVKDEGIGIHNSASLFQVGSEEMQRRDHNHGLGLILCKEFVEKHGGIITAGNHANKGAIFTFTLPKANPATDEERKPEVLQESLSISLNEDVHAENDSHPVVLIAEDDDDIRWYIKQVLHPEFHVLEAINGQQAWPMVLEKMPDLILSDLTMPGGGGFEFCKQVKSHRQSCHIPFLMLTAERSKEMKISGYQFGADDYITKPIDPQVLRARTQNIIDGRKKLKAIYRSDIACAPETFTTNPLDQEFLEKLNSIIESHITSESLNPDTLAKEMNMSRTGLYMKVKGLTGESVGIYIRNVRLKEARKLLKSRRMNISEVAYAVGFNQLPYFTTCFKEAFGITPSEFINGPKV
jgi:ligand-binding sensor domain-containing protein/signal transduction histidine kinase/DNA-binding response OmpR family regulator